VLRQRGRLERERQFRVQRWSRERRLLGLLATVLQDLGREVMPLEHSTDPSMVHREVIRLPDDPGQFAVGKRVGDRQLHEVLLDVTRQEGFDSGLPCECGS
jgi:hypothetical protein